MGVHRRMMTTSRAEEIVEQYIDWTKVYFADSKDIDVESISEGEQQAIDLESCLDEIFKPLGTLKSEIERRCEDLVKLNTKGAQADLQILAQLKTRLADLQILAQFHGY